ncbi:unnamed protein product [Coregonus sp. 'balchen']|nr:unnamed protein product [Coregonus sp. 'balchen']
MQFSVLMSVGEQWEEIERSSQVLPDDPEKNVGMGHRSIEERVQEEAKMLANPMRCFTIINKAKDDIQGQAEICLKTLDTSDPQDFIEAFLVKMLEEKDNHNTEFNYENMVMTVWNLFSAGTETTSSTIHLLSDEVPSCSRECSEGDRRVIRDTEFHNYLIPEGTMVLPLLSSVLADPKLFKNLDEFDPENFLDENGRFKKNDGFFPFGGSGLCLGEALARLELFLLFTSLLQRFTFTGTRPPEEINIDPACYSFGRMPPSYDCYIKLRTEE